MKKELKAAIIGSGFISEIHIQAMQRLGIKVIGVFSLDMHAAQRLCMKYNLHVYETQKDLLCDDIDIIAICTPSGTHADLAISALKHGKYAIIEKPIVLSDIEGNRILEAEKQTGKFCAPISQLRFSDTYHVIKRAIDNGDLGQILLGSLSMKYFRSPDYYAGSWRGTKSMDGGGALMNQGIHGIDLMCGLLGYPKKISGHVATLYHKIEVEDTAVASLVFPSGALGIIEAGTAITHSKPRCIEISGEYASVAIEEDVLVSAEGIDLMGGIPTEIQSWKNPSAFSADLHTAQYRNICAAIRGEEPLYYTALDAVNTVQVILSIYESSETGKTIIIKP